MDIYEQAEELARSAAGITIKAHGKVWTVAQARAQIARLEARNNDPNGPGPSDGRVTEINNLREALDARDRVFRETLDRATRELEIQKWKAELAKIGTADVQGDYTIVAIAGRYSTRQRRKYRTEQGFLRGLINIRSKGGEIIWADD